MKGILSATTLFALVAGLVSAAPLEKRSNNIPADSNVLVITNPAPHNIVPNPPGSSGGIVQIVNGNNEIDTIVSFTLSPAPNPGSTCQFYMQNLDTVSGSGIVQLFSLGYELSVGNIPYYDQYEGQYDLNTNPSTAIDRPTVPCTLNNGNPQFVIRPQNTDDTVTWTQSASSGAFLLYTP